MQYHEKKWTSEVVALQYGGNTHNIVCKAVTTEHISGVFTLLRNAYLHWFYNMHIAVATFSSPNLTLFSYIIIQNPRQQQIY